MIHSGTWSEPERADADGSVLLGRWRHMVRVPQAIWQRHLKGEDRLGFMSEDHHRVRNFVVRELPRLGEPIPPHFIARELGLLPQQVIHLLDDLERHKTFLFRNEAGAVAWAYPVTVAETPHLATFDSGEQVHAA